MTAAEPLLPCEHKDFIDGEFYLWCQDCGALNAEGGGKKHWTIPRSPQSGLSVEEMAQIVQKTPKTGMVKQWNIDWDWSVDIATAIHAAMRREE